MIERVLRASAAAGSAMAVAALALLMLVTVVDVSGRYLLNKPVFGSVEISEFLMVILSFGALALAELRNGHITVDFFVTSLPRRGQALLDAFGALIGIVFWGFVAWRALVHAGRIREAGEVSANWAVPTYPFYIALAVGTVLFAVALVVRLIRALRVGAGAWTTPPSA